MLVLVPTAMAYALDAPNPGPGALGKQALALNDLRRQENCKRTHPKTSVSLRDQCKLRGDSALLTETSHPATPTSRQGELCVCVGLQIVKLGGGLADRLRMQGMAGYIYV